MIIELTSAFSALRMMGWVFSFTFVSVFVPLLLLGYNTSLQSSFGLAAATAAATQFVNLVSPPTKTWNPFAIPFTGAAIGLITVGLLHALNTGLNPSTVIALIGFLALASTPATRHKTQPPNIRQSLGVLATSWLGILAASPILVRLRGNDQILTTYLDLPLHEAISRSIGLLGISDTSYFPGRPMRYHWMADSWADFYREIAGSDPFSSVSILVPVASIVFSSGAAWAIGWSVRSQYGSGLFAALFLALGSFPLGNMDGIRQMVIAEISPTHSMAAPIMLILVLCVVGLFRYQTVTKGNATIIVLLAFSLSVARAPQSFVAVIALSSVALALLIYLKAFKPILLVLLLCALPALLGLIAFVMGGTANSFTFGWNGKLSAAKGYLPYSGTGDILLGNLALVGLSVWPILVVLPLIWIAKRKESVVWVTLVAGCSTAALTMGVFSDQAGLGQVTFLWASYLLSLPVCGAVFYLITREFEIPKVATLSILGLFVGALGSLLIHLTVTVQFGGVFRWLFAMLPVFIIVAFCMRSRQVRRHQTLVMSASIMLATIMVGSGTIASLWDIRTLGSSFATVDISRDQFAAGEWVLENTPEDAVLVTNLQCDSPTRNQSECSSTSYVTSALSGRRVLIEGIRFSDWPPSEEGLRRLSTSLTLSPTELKRYGVSWIWIDSSAYIQPQIPPEARLRFKSGPISVYEFTTSEVYAAEVS